MVDVKKHYFRRDVAEEIFRYSRMRWAALEGRLGSGRVFIRYRNNVPLHFTSPEDVSSTIVRYSGIGVRTIYVTAAVWRSLKSKGDVEHEENIVKYTPFWDVDLVSGEWRAALAAAEAVVKVLESEGVSESVYLLWSGRGVHVRVNENALSDDLLEELGITPVDAAFAIVEYVLRKGSEAIKGAAKRSGGEVKVENLVDAKRVFTAPLSLHRELDRVAVCFTPDELSSFTLEWTNPSSFKHNPCWGKHYVGELDDLLRKALREIDLKAKRHAAIATSPEAVARKARKAPQPRPVPRRVGRFQVMGLLQAARYYLLYGDLEKAKSFGLNRAIFYAWAKKRGQVAARKAYGISPSVRARTSSKGREGVKLVEAAGEEAFQAPSGFFTMGGEEQRPEDYDRQIAEKIEGVVPYEKAWEAALKYLRKFPKHVLLDPRKFYEKVYKPVRDDFNAILEVLNESEDKGEEKGGERRDEPERKEESKPSKRDGGLLRFMKRS